jgi:TPR repeat protein
VRGAALRWRLAAEAGYRVAQANLAFLSESSPLPLPFLNSTPRGQGAAGPDLQSAACLYRRAADQGDVPSRRRLAALHVSAPQSLGLEPAAAAGAALQLYLESGGDSESLFGAGWIVEAGLARPPDPQHAEELYRRAEAAAAAGWRRRRPYWESRPSRWGALAARLAVWRLQAMGSWGRAVDAAAASVSTGYGEGPHTAWAWALTFAAGLVAWAAWRLR